MDSSLTPPGHPGIPARWTSSAKNGVGTSTGAQSPVWFTLSHGIVNEVYYPRLDQANIRDLGLIVSDGGDFLSEEKRHTVTLIENLSPGVPAYRMVNTCVQGRYRIYKTVFTDPRRACLMQHIRFEVLAGPPEDYRLYALLSPHLFNQGADNSGWAGNYKGLPMLFAQGHGRGLALACSLGWSSMSCGYVGTSDGWHELHNYKKLNTRYREARNGNIALTGEVDLTRGTEFLMVLSFGQSADEAGMRARLSLQSPWEDALAEYMAGWEDFQSTCRPLADADPNPPDIYRVSTSVLRTHHEKTFPGGLIASLSIPWGFSKGDNDLGGYHLVWPRDQVETAGALLACGDTQDAREVLLYLRSVQDADGHWPQNMWLDGTPYWTGIQLDETAFPILLADALYRAEALGRIDAWAMVRSAASYLICQGPVTHQDRWEENGGYSPFTLAVVIAGLLAAADFADRSGEPSFAAYCRETADAWNDQIERWTYATGTALAAKVGVEGYYVRIAPPEVADAGSPVGGMVPVKNRPHGESSVPAEELISPDALALVRFGLRAADDPRITNTVKVIDAVLKTETTSGPVWHRYNLDGYGEQEDGSPFDGTGIGRGWPLLTGERAHYELAAGNREEADRLCGAMELTAGQGGLFPEQIWDAPDIPARELYNGHYTGSAMPLVWAHAEFIKLRRSLTDGHVFDLPPQTVQRYLVEKVRPAHHPWRFTQQSSTLPEGLILRIETLAPARVRWSVDEWETVADSDSRDTGTGLHATDLPTAGLTVGARVLFTFYWPQSGRWEGVDFVVSAG
ncbi:MAG TPA: glucan 1,4-alpha-glucosidase [Verrucomicrobiales bacterium]|nr:glucan 1,4-alpha-glucosidase [Verrucomicrobiales bacterium]